MTREKVTQKWNKNVLQQNGQAKILHKTDVYNKLTVRQQKTRIQYSAARRKKTSLLLAKSKKPREGE